MRQDILKQTEEVLDRLAKRIDALREQIEKLNEKSEAYEALFQGRKKEPLLKPEEY